MELSDLPDASVTIKLPFLPPTQNRYFIQSRGRLIKSNEARVFDTRCLREKLKQRFKAMRIKTAFDGKYLRVDTWYCVDQTRVIGKKDQVKQFDFMNFQKMAWDGLAKVIEIDDRWFKSGFHELLLCNGPEDEGLIFKISPLDVLYLYDDFKTVFGSYSHLLKTSS